MYVLSYHSIVLSTIYCLVLKKMKNKDEKVVPPCSDLGRRWAGPRIRNPILAPLCPCLTTHGHLFPMLASWDYYILVDRCRTVDRGESDT